MSTLFSLACSALCCIGSFALIGAIVVFAYKMLSGGSEEPTVASPIAKDPEPVPPKEEPAPPAVRKAPELPPLESAPKTPIKTSDPFDEEEMATVVAPPEMMSVPMAPPPPPPPSEPAKPKRPTPPPSPPRSSGQTIIAFDDDEDF